MFPHSALTIDSSTFEALRRMSFMLEMLFRKEEEVYLRESKITPDFRPEVLSRAVRKVVWVCEPLREAVVEEVGLGLG